MNDPYEEERRARFDQPINGLVWVLDRVREELLDAKGSETHDEWTARYEGAMNLLFNTINLANPVAHVWQRNGRTAFLWVDTRAESPPPCPWVVCYSDGTFRQGTQNTQEACEAEVNRLLDEPE